MAILITSKSQLNKFQKKNRNKKISLCHGVFDVVHIGHLKHFDFAKKQADVLVVSVTTDKFVNKGKDRPIFDVKNRLNFLKSIKCIDYIIESKFSNAEKVIQLVKPNFYFKDIEYKKDLDLSGNLKKEKNALKKINSKIIYTDLGKFSSTSIINKFRDSNKTIIDFKNKINKYDYHKNLEKIVTNKLNALVVGEGILDTYIYTYGLGKSGKDSILTVAKEKENTYLGGSYAISNILSKFCKKVYLISDIGINKKKEKFIIDRLNRNIVPNFIRKKNVPITEKTKMVDLASGNKILGLYDFNDRILNKKEEERLLSTINKLKDKIDFIIVSDYDHGLISKKVFNKIKKLKKPIICNLQVNSSNVAYHDLNKLAGSDLLIVNKSELELFYKRKLIQKNNTQMIKDFIKRCKYKSVIVTFGKDGSYYIDKKGDSFYCPAFETKPEGDKIGSGDTYMVFSALAKANKLKPDFALTLSTFGAMQNLKGFGNSFEIKEDLFIKDFRNFIS